MVLSKCVKDRFLNRVEVNIIAVEILVTVPQSRDFVGLGFVIYGI